MFFTYIHPEPDRKKGEGGKKAEGREGKREGVRSLVQSNLLQFLERGEKKEKGGGGGDVPLPEGKKKKKGKELQLINLKGKEGEKA